MFAFGISLALAAGSAAAPPANQLIRIPYIETLFTGDDYPPEALRRNEQGIVGVLVRVSPEGDVADCRVESSSGSAALDTQTCDLIRLRARFEPARDRKGRKIASEFHRKVSWRLEDGPMPSEPWSVRVSMTFGADGTATTCNEQREGSFVKAGEPASRSCEAQYQEQIVRAVRELEAPIIGLSIEQRFDIGSSPSPRALRPDEIMVSHSTLDLQVDAAGKLTSCTSVNRVARTSCESVAKTYSPRNGAGGRPAPFAASMTTTTFIQLDRNRAIGPLPATGSLQGLITSDDYPPQALERNEQGTTDVLVHVDASGAISGCDIEKSSGSDVLDAQSCRIVSTRAKFVPGHDAQGKAVAGKFHSRISWRIGEDEELSDDWSKKTILEMATDGQSVTCHVEADGAMAPLPGERPESCPDDFAALASSGRAQLPAGRAFFVLEERFSLGSKPIPVLGTGDKLIARQILRLNIDAQGKVTSCKVVEQSGPVPVEEPCAELIKNTTYRPRQGPNGHNAPFTALKSYTIYWRLEKIALADQPINLRP